ncbi:MAG: hypothetical protein R3335_15620, partial [Anaerolineales bacterium]|nr:hypothetical protein [Anaerolineales bacterium]
VQALKEAAQSEDVDRIKKASEEVEHAFHALSQQMYAQSQEQAGPQPGANGHSAPAGEEGEDEGDEVVEGEFREA